MAFKNFFCKGNWVGSEMAIDLLAGNDTHRKHHLRYKKIHNSAKTYGILIK